MAERDDTASAERPWHALEPGEALARLGSGARGLDDDEAGRRRARVGPNALPEPGRRSLLRVFLSQFASPLIYLLLVAAAIAAALGERTDALVIVAVLLVNAVIGSFQEGRAERSMAALRRMAGARVRVLRAGEERTLDARQLVPGDVLLLAAGDGVGADARLLEAAALRAVEASLTGESEPCGKDPAPVPEDTPVADRQCMLYAGTHVVTGRGRAVVVTTGTSTEIGRIALLAESAGVSPTPLERRVSQLGRLLALAAVAVFALVLAVGLLRGLPPAKILGVSLIEV